jgi:tripartite-type tricarboxylate transporter receptor subunit TctC
LVLGGQLRALAVTSDVRNLRVPAVPTLSETVPDFVSVSFTGMVAPAGVSPAIVEKLNAPINASLRVPAVQATLAQLSVEITPGSAEDFGAFLAREKAKWQAVARAAKIEPD